MLAPNTYMYSEENHCALNLGDWGKQNNNKEFPGDIKPEELKFKLVSNISKTNEGSADKKYLC